MITSISPSFINHTLLGVAGGKIIKDLKKNPIKSSNINHSSFALLQGQVKP